MKQAHTSKLFLAVFTTPIKMDFFLSPTIQVHYRVSIYKVSLSILRGLQRIKDSSRFLRNNETGVSVCFIREAVNGALRKGKEFEKEGSLNQKLKILSSKCEQMS